MKILAFAPLILLAAVPTRAEGPDLAASLRPFVERGTLAGAVVLVGSKDAVLDLEAVGYADVAARVPMKTDALFWIASMNKAMTAAALMVLVDEGKVKLDDPVANYLPEFRHQRVVVEESGDLLVLKTPARPPTVRNLLSPTAGLVGRSPLEGKLDSLPIREGSITYGLSPLKFEPGSKYEYCNPGINTAGRIVEVASGEPYERFLKRRILDPLAMTETTFWPTESQFGRVARSYKVGPDGKLQAIEIDQLTYPLTDRTRRHPYPAGGLFSTAEDVGKFCRMLLGGGTLGGRRVLSEASVREMTSTQTGSILDGGKGEGGYGLGLSTSRKARPDAVIPGPCGHGGAYATDMQIDPERGIVTVFMVQHAGYPNGEGPRVAPDFQKAARLAYPKAPSGGR